MTYNSLISQAFNCHQNGDLEGAKTACEAILWQNPSHADALHLLGMIHYQEERTASAIDLITKAIRIFPSNPYYYNNLGSAFKSCGKLEKSKSSYKKALSLRANYPEALYNIAGLYHFEGKYDQALLYYQKAIFVNQQFPEALNNMAATLNILRKYDEAIECCKEAIKIKANYGEPFNNMGNAYNALGDIESAIACYRKSMTLSGESAEVLCNYANALQENGMIDDAIALYKQAIKLAPTYGKTYNNLGIAYRSKRKLKEAELQFKKCMKLIPEDAEAYHNLGNIYYDQGAYASAALWYDRALSINPETVQTLINRGIIYQETGDSDAALYNFSKALEIDPRNSKAHSHLVHELYQRCEWPRIKELNTKIDKLTESELENGHRPNEMPFLNLIRSADPLINFRVAKRWSRELSKSTLGKLGTSAFKHTYQKHKKITIGYLSNNFRNHPTSHLINDIFDLHDRSRFAINAYSYGEDDGSLYREKIQKKCDAFVDIQNSTHENAAQRIFNDRVDILVDLVGYMRGNRLEICAYRPAPIQVRWLGLAGTTGADFFDYLISDRIATPEDHASFYSESFVYMPDTYQANSQPVRKSTAIFDRGDLGLPEHGFIFCCFCSSYKIEPIMFRNWMEILNKVSGSVLWLLKSSPAVVENLRREASICGINPERLIFADKVPIEDHLQRIRHADLGIDTRIVNGAATTSDALRAGVPVLTMKGSHFASRMSASILNAIGLGAFVVETGPAYVQRAVELGNNPLVVQEIKATLKIYMHTKPLFDTHLFVRNLETAYIKMWERHRNGKNPEMLQVSGG